MRPHRQRAITTRGGRRLRLTDLLLVLAITSVLLILAVPFVYTTLIRGEIALSLARALPLQREIEQQWALTGRFPTSNAQAGLRSPGDYASGPVTEIRVSHEPTPGSLLLCFGIEALGDHNEIVLSPSATAAGLKWNCHHSRIATQFLPARCGRPAIAP